MAGPSTLRHPSRRWHGSRGFTYLSLVIFISVIALLTAASLKLGSVLQRSRAEQELLDIGMAYSDALKSYADATPQGQVPQPPSLKELLKDPRFPGTRRHLRKIFVDPMTGKAEWGVVYMADKVGVLAVYSLSDAKPVKIGNFPPRFSGFEGKNHISDWKFVASTESKNAPVAPQNQEQNASTVAGTQQNSLNAPQNSSAPISSVANPPAAPPAPAPPPSDEPATPYENPVNPDAEKPPAAPKVD